MFKVESTLDVNDLLDVLRKNNVLGFELGEFKVTFKGIADPKNEIDTVAGIDSNVTTSWEKDILMQTESDMGL